MRVITWNLFHGRAVPDQPRDLFDEFLAAIESWEWDALLLQECPPWWPRPLAQATRASFRSVLTSRNAGLALRRAIATRRPDLIKANGGGCNAILVRGQEIVEHRHERIRHLPERRLVHGVGLERGAWLCNLHMQGARSHVLAPNPLVENVRAAVAARQWAGDEAQIVLGGDFNVARPELIGFTQVPGHRGVDQIFVRNGAFEGQAKALERGSLSDHRPVAATIVLK